MDKYRFIGTFVKPHGFKGKLIIYSEVQIHKKEPLFVEINQTRVPFFIEELSQKSGKQYIVKLQDVDSQEKAESFRNKNVYSSYSHNTTEEKQDIKYQLIGFTVFDKIHGEVGPVEEILEFPGHDVLKIKSHEGAEVLVPFNDHFVIEVDTDTRRINISTPEGLLDLNK